MNEAQILLSSAEGAQEKRKSIAGLRAKVYYRDTFLSFVGWNVLVRLKR
jgi:hypothetical protein